MIDLRVEEVLKGFTFLNFFIFYFYYHYYYCYFDFA